MQFETWVKSTSLPRSPVFGSLDEVKAGSVNVEAFDRTISILDLPSLIKAKRAAGRQKDLAVLPELESLLEASEP